MVNLTTNLKDFLDPFEDLSNFLIACNVVKNVYSVKKDNFQQVSQTINSLIKKQLPAYSIKNFVDKVVAFPSTYGFEFVTNFEKITANVRGVASSSNMNTLVITPLVLHCYLCKTINSQTSLLVVKQLPLAKDVMVFKRNTIGNFFIVLFWIWLT
jgi:hypothetical protein